MPEIPAHEIILVKTPEERQQCYDIRIEVFTNEQGFPLDTEIDDLEDVSVHFLLRLTPSLTPVGTIRLVPKRAGQSYYKLTRLAVHKGYRGHFRFGSELVEALHDYVKQTALLDDPTAESATIVCHSQIKVQGFYRRFGYLPEGDQFDEEGDPHQKMVLRLPRSALRMPMPL